MGILIPKNLWNLYLKDKTANVSNQTPNPNPFPRGGKKHHVLCGSLLGPGNSTALNMCCEWNMKTKQKKSRPGQFLHFQDRIHGQTGILGLAARLALPDGYHCETVDMDLKGDYKHLVSS